jgi:serine/threonine-protein kinase
MTGQPSGGGRHALEAGSTLGPYRIIGKLGEGGMGEVYRAEDPRLGRTVAIKAIPQLFATDADRTARFEREARVLATLNHPNIAQIYGIEEKNGTHAIVMELVEGEDLARRLARGPMVLEDAVQIARQVSDAVEAAHEQSIVHRDLKPANIKLRPDGTVKVLDFGLAKMVCDDARGDDRQLHDSPTFTSPAWLGRGSADVTAAGVILGTAAYMAPEQVRGRTVDRRADIWAFGCVLFEMLTGRPPFAGPDTSSLLAAILKDDVDWAMLPDGTPTSIRRLLRRCLEKDPRRRLSAVGDARLELDDAFGDFTDVPEIPARLPWSRRLAWLAGAGAVGALITLAVTPRAPADVRTAVVRSEVLLEGTLRLAGVRAFTISPDASEIVYMAAVDRDKWALFRRSLRTGATVQISATEWGEGPFFSPDGAWLVFGQQGRLKKVPSAGGAAIDLGDAPGWQGGSFAGDGSLILNPRHGQGLVRISADGRSRSVLTTVDQAAGEAGHHWPHVLPDGKHVLYTAEVDGKSYSEARIVMLSLDTGERRVLIEGGTDARYLRNGHIVYWREGGVWKVPFDTNRLDITGQPSLAIQNVMASEANGQAHFAAVSDGTLVYLTGRDTQTERSVMLVDRAGRARALTGDRRSFETVSSSRDGARLAVTITAANDSLWTMELDRPSLTRITFESENAYPVWSPDGTRIVLARHRGGEPRKLFVMPSDGSIAPELLRGEIVGMPESWTAAGNLLAFTRPSAENGIDIWVMPMVGDGGPRQLLATRFDEMHPRFSPDARWIAYTSNESGRYEVYVRPFPGFGQKRLVSSDGGMEPRWGSDGRELFYRAGDAVMVADVSGSRIAPPRVLFRGRYTESEVHWPTWDVLPDGRGFLMIQDFAQPRTSLSLVHNWFAELR